MEPIDHNKRQWLDFLELLEKAFDKGFGDQIFQLLLTPDERDLFGTRVRIVKELMSGEMTQREMRSELKVGIATITRGSNCLKSASPELKAWLEQELLGNENEKSA